jgi:Zn-dependent protease
MESLNLIDGMMWYLVFLFSTTVHEAAHAFTAMKLGDNTAYHGGQVTLDPVPHIRREPLGTVLVPILSFLMSGWMIGWASTPYDPYWAQRYPRRSAWMSLAGPASNLFLVLFSALAIRIGIATGYFVEPDSINFTHVAAASGQSGIFTAAAIILSIMFTLNLLLFVFNLLPFPPLDGSSALPLLLKEEHALSYMNFFNNSSFSFIGLFIAWNVFDKLFDPIHLLAINLLYPGANYH